MNRIFPLFLTTLLGLTLSYCNNDDESAGSSGQNAELDRCCNTEPVEETIGEVFVYIPSAFSPNGDGVNDRFRPVVVNSLDLSSANVLEMLIMDVNGEPIYREANFDPSNAGSGWDGLFLDGTRYEEGSFSYAALIDPKDVSGVAKWFEGRACLLRCANDNCDDTQLRSRFCMDCFWETQHDGEGKGDIRLDSGEGFCE